MLICLSPLAILLKITFVIHEGEEAKEPSTCEEEPSRACRAIAGETPLNSALARQSHAPCLAQGPGSSARPCQSPAQQEEASSGQQMLLTLTPVTKRKGQEKSWRGSDLFSLSGVGRWGWGGKERDGTSQDCCSPSKLSLSACHCLTTIATEKENKIGAIIKATQPFQINTLLE